MKPVRFQFNPLYSILALAANGTLVWYLNVDVSFYPLVLPDPLIPLAAFNALAAQFFISAIMPGIIGPIAQAAGKNQQYSVFEALYQGSIIPGYFISFIGGLFHYLFGTPNLIPTVTTVVLMTIIPCACLVLWLRWHPAVSRTIQKATA